MTRRLSRPSNWPPDVPRLRIKKAYPVTPDGRYFVVSGKLWRCTNPNLDTAERERLVGALMKARRAVQAAKGNPHLTVAARKQVNNAKIALGERGPVWWTDGTPDYNRRDVAHTPYAEWFASISTA